ncbi:efflux transporter periplasmic adaptor subunit [Chromobacterium sp. ATCC 53434]|uniref:efflux RND transporter periplasmic adaptor subunit n=1 Tax=Chromobacterium sp. (strain ATCC 53434 / SC 14030) TaxID=2059672 RepID=UPI000C778BFF|nr:efflux RND transporter periplasmic adaptor subunit [Chromobacterium sp. ATCC 53434]AUH51920.1 efflux transporter periplasmic adaptor subunit [Chromobacterium sp. ATCC 53434]
MNTLIRKAGPVALTLTLVVVAALVARHIWDYYTNAPWTRDGHIGADVVQVAPDVSGLITEVKVGDNQLVKKGQLLFVVDRAHFTLALRQAEAAAAAQRATLEQARREAARNHALTDLVAREAQEEGDAKVRLAEASLAAAEAAVGIARLNLERTAVTSPVDGYLNDRTPRAGDYAAAGRPVLSVVDARSFHVDGYFEETKLGSLAPNEPVDIQIMGDSRTLRGHVQSIAAGIENRDRSNGASLLPNVNPTFNWVRLAQRIPVRISLDEVPADFRLIAGRTATVSVRPGKHS